jgi:hypothetical protein
MCSTASAGKGSTDASPAASHQASRSTLTVRSRTADWFTIKRELNRWVKNCIHTRQIRWNYTIKKRSLQMTDDGCIPWKPLFSLSTVVHLRFLHVADNPVNRHPRSDPSGPGILIGCTKDVGSVLLAFTPRRLELLRPPDQVPSAGGEPVPGRAISVSGTV